MTTFSQMTYKRPDFDALFAQGKDLLQKMEGAKTKEELFQGMKELD